MKLLIKILILSTLIFSLASCGEINEEMWLNKDGSGKVEYQVDVGESLPMIMMMVQGAAQQQLEGMEMDNKEGVQDKMGEIMEKINSEKVDTSLNIFDVMPDSIKRVTENPDQLKKMNFFIDLDSEENVALLKFAIDFDNFQEIDQMLKKLVLAFGSGRPELESMNIDGALNDFSFDNSNYFTKKEFKQRKMSPSGGAGGMDEMLGEGEGAQMAEMMFGNTKYNKTIHFPYKIKSVSGADAKIDGNTITIQKDFMEMMKEDQSKELQVVFKKKFLGIF